MPVLLEGYSRDSSASEALRIGLVNNMGDEALRSTERQYISLLEEASGDQVICLSFYTLPGISRKGSSAIQYSSVEELWSGQLDGLIVTGREPVAADMREEPYWDSFIRMLTWAQQNTHATVWSCLAAHAAVLHMDGVCREKRDEKLFGVFACQPRSEHWLLRKVRTGLELPHSRWNSLTADKLQNAGYEVLTQTADGEVDTFIKHGENLSIFFQGHPEYGSDTLTREYRRDIARYFRGESEQYPSLPQNYFDRVTVAALESFEGKYALSRDQSQLPALLALLDGTTVANTWRPHAIRIYQNLLQWIDTQKRLGTPATSRKLMKAALASRLPADPEAVATR